MTWRLAWRRVSSFPPSASLAFFLLLLSVLALSSLASLHSPDAEERARLLSLAVLDAPDGGLFLLRLEIRCYKARALFSFSRGRLLLPRFSGVLRPSILTRFPWEQKIRCLRGFGEESGSPKLQVCD